MNQTLRPLPMRVTPRQYERLTQARDRDGLTIQEHVRRALDLYLAGIEKHKPNPPVAVQTPAEEVAPRVRMR